MKFTGLYFGSFNPIHNGHLIVAEAMMNTGQFEKIRFVVSPQNPFKTVDHLMPEKLRFELVKKAIAGNRNFEVSDVEFHLPTPSYTIHTVEFFQEFEPHNQYAIIMGSDNLKLLHEWKNIDKLAEICDFFIYNRRGSEQIEPKFSVRKHWIEAPFVDISATFIREQLAANKSLKYLVPDAVIQGLKGKV